MAANPENSRAPARSRASSLGDLQARSRSRPGFSSRALRSPAVPRRPEEWIEYRVLGPFEVLRHGEGVVRLASARERGLLLCLLLRSNEIVPAESVIDSVWGQRPPRCATSALQNGVSHLRKLLEPGGSATESQVLLTRPPGYLLHVDEQQLDSDRVEALLERSRQAIARGALEQAVRLLRKAECLWRGPALADFSCEEFARSEIARLNELRLLTIAERIDIELALGRHAFLVCELTRLVGEHPLNERLRGQLMLALYRAGRQADALAVYRDGRETLVEQLAIAPCRPLRILERAILRQEPLLDQLDMQALVPIDPLPGGKSPLETA